MAFYNLPRSALVDAGAAIVAGPANTVIIAAGQKQLFEPLSPEERMIAESLLQAAPSYRYNLRGFPPLETIPEPGPASAAAAAKAMMAWIRSRRLD